MVTGLLHYAVYDIGDFQGNVVQKPDSIATLRVPGLNHAIPLKCYQMINDHVLSWQLATVIDVLSLSPIGETCPSILAMSWTNRYSLPNPIS
ncbi:MAG: hypothetical protein JWM11_2709 [Planctomycetaceae bacterium]|nr:hypothetical protein [Planctomycetaceae bacterium]